MAYNTINLLREQAKNRQHSATAFDTSIADSTSSLLDLPSSYPFNSERYALIQEGTVDDTNFEDTTGEFALSINGNEGDVIELKARQRVTYLPNYELLVGAACYMENELEPGQKLTIEYADPEGENGYFTELTSDTRRSYIKNGGVEIDSTEWGKNRTVDPYSRDDLDETVPQVFRGFINWYGDGRYKSTLSFADEDAVMQNPTVALCANRGEVATEEINLNISVRLECTEATTANTVNVLSFGAANRGDSSTTNRTKAAHNWDLGGDIGAEDFTAILALRRIPDKEQVITQIDNFEIIPEDTMEVAAIAFDESETDASGWDVPPQLDPENTAVEQTTSISTFPTDANDNPDGRLLDLVISSSQGNRSDSSAVDVQSEFYEDEILAFLARTKSASNSSVDLTWRSRQEW